MTEQDIKKKPEKPPEEELKLSELLILASMWMLFGFMLWFYLSAFHGAPARIAADHILSLILQDDFHRIIVEPNQHFLFQVETKIPFTFRDGTTELLGFIVNPLVFSYGLPLLFGLLVLMVAYALLLRPAGFLLSTTGFLVLGSVILGERRFHIMIPVALLATGVVWYLVQGVLGIFLRPLPFFLG